MGLYQIVRKVVPLCQGARGLREFSLISLSALLTLAFPTEGRTQGTLAPLLLFTNGAGSIAPLQNGQLLEVGQNYQLTAIPDSGFMFQSWQPVNVFAFMEVLTDVSGSLQTNTSIVVSPVPIYTVTSSLIFTMQTAQLILDIPGVREITESHGWQANFAPVPEPSAGKLIACGLAAVVLLRRTRVLR
jgi:hypothetical protein